MGFFCLQPLILPIPERFGVLVLFWLGWGWVCAWQSPEPVVSCLRQVEWTVLVLFTGVLVRAVGRYPFLPYWMMGLVLIGFCLVCTGIMTYWFLLQDPQQYNWVGMMPHFTNIRHFGYYTTAALLFSSFGISLYATDPLRSGKWCYLLFIMQIIAFGFLFWSGSRGSMLGVAAGLFWMGFCLKEWHARLRFGLFTTCFFLAGLYGSSFFYVDHGSLGLWHALDRTSDAGTLQALFSGRTVLWEIAWNSVHPPEGSLLFGYGPDRLRLHPDMLGYVQAHNVFFQMLSETGLLGLVLFSILLSFVYTSFFRCRKRDTGALQPYLLQCTGQSVWIGFFPLSLIDGVFYHALPLTVLGTALAITFFRSDENRMQDSGTGQAPME